MVESFPNNYIQPLCLETTIIRGVRYLQVAESRTQVRFPKYPKDPSDYYADYEIDKTLLEHAILNAIKLAE